MITAGIPKPLPVSSPGVERFPRGAEILIEALLYEGVDSAIPAVQCCISTMSFGGPVID